MDLRAGREAAGGAAHGTDGIPKGRLPAAPCGRRSVGRAHLFEFWGGSAAARGACSGSAAEVRGLGHGGTARVQKREIRGESELEVDCAQLQRVSALSDTPSNAESYDRLHERRERL